MATINNNSLQVADTKMQGVTSKQSIGGDKAKFDAALGSASGRTGGGAPGVISPMSVLSTATANVSTQGVATAGMSGMGSAGFSSMGGGMTGVSSNVTGGGMALGAGVNALPGSGGGMGQVNSGQGISGGTDPTAGNAINATGGSTGALMDQTKQMQEMQMSFNLQYLNLQNSMQNESRQFTMVSNIMKTKHDTVKNTISNVR